MSLKEGQKEVDFGDFATKFWRHCRKATQLTGKLKHGNIQL